MKKFYFFSILVLGISVYAMAQDSNIDSSKYPPPVTFTAQQDKQNMMQQLGIKTLRPGPSGNESAPNHANYDTSIADPCPQLPEILKLKNGKKVTTPATWWNHRRPEIVEDYESEVYGRIPEKVPSVTWSVKITDREFIFPGYIPVIAKQIVGHIDNNEYPLINVDIKMILVVPVNVKGPVPVLMMFGSPSFPAPAQPSADDLEKLNATFRELMIKTNPEMKEIFEKYPAYSPVTRLPAKDKQDIFRIGVATGTSPTGPFQAEPKPIEGSYSIDPAVFTDTDGESYMYFGGIWGGQLQKWQTGKFDPSYGQEPTDSKVPALMPKMAKLTNDMLHFEGPVKDVAIVDSSGKFLLAGDHNRRFFEAPWVHKYKGKYYLSYSKGDTHFTCYAISESPSGLFTCQGVVLNPVQGWTNHESILEINGKWYIFYHDTQLPGKTHLRNIKVTELRHNEDGTIELITTYKE